jgi:V/A-type H+/Na+-transporting ATPase subunit E
LKVNYTENLKSGFSIGPADGSYKINFTEDDFASFFKHYLRPRAIKILYGE